MMVSLNQSKSNRFQKFLALLFLSLLAGLLAPSAPLRADDALDVYNYAVGSYQQERWEQAAEGFAKFTERFPTHPKVSTARLYHGLSLTNLKKYKEARPVWRDFVRDYPNNNNLPVATYRVAESSYLLNDLKAAETEFQAFLAKYPDNDLAEWALPFLAETQLYLKKPAEAVKSYELAKSKYPKGRLIDDVRFGLARAYEELKQPEQAAAIYQAVAQDETNPRAAQALLNWGMLDFETKNYAAAAERFSTVEVRFPESELVATARLNAGYAWYQVGDYRKAIAQFDKAAEDKSQRVLAGYWKGVSHKSLGEYAEAARILKATHELGDAGSLADNVLYQWADSAFRNADYPAARDRFLQVVNDFPKSEFVEDSLHLAGEAALYDARETKDAAERVSRMAEAEKIINSFPERFPQSALAMHHEMLVGRLLYQQGGAGHFADAAERFRTVLTKSQVPETQLLARFHLGRTLQKLEKHREVVTVMEPVIAEVTKTGAGSELLSGLVIVGLSHLANQEDKQTIEHVTSYLELASDGEEADLALAARALARARLKQKDQAKEDLSALRDKFPGSPLLPERIYQIAEMAYDQKDWAWAAELFSMILKLETKSTYYQSALSGLAWTEYQSGKFLEAAADFERLATEFPDDVNQAAEAVYLQGRSLEEAGDLKAATKAYQTAFTKFAPPEPAKPGQEQERPMRFAFLAGVQSARTLALQKQPAEADAAYQALLAKFPKPQNLDKLLDEWALMNLQAERYERSDAIFKTLMKDVPNSSLADNARLSLAESDFIAGRLLDAKQVFGELAESEKSDAEVKERASFQLLEILTEQRAWDQLLPLGDRFLKTYLKSQYRPTVLFRTAEAFVATEKFPEAVPLLSQLRDSKSNAAVAEARWFPRVWVLLAECQLRQKNYDEVRATVSAFREWDPKNNQLYEADEVLGRAYKNEAKWEEARTAFQRTLDHPSSNGTETAAKSQLMIAETHWHEEQWAKAREAYLKVYYIYKTYPEWQAPALYQAAACDEKLGDLKQAAKSYAELIEKFPKSEFNAKAKDRWQELQKKL